MIDYNVSGGDSGVKVETYAIEISSHTTSQKNLEVWYTSIDDGVIAVRMARLTPGKTKTLNVVEKTWLHIMSQDLTSELRLGGGNFAGFISVDKTLYCLQCTGDGYTQFIVS